jgi:putative Holliday junction resolvase
MIVELILAKIFRDAIRREILFCYTFEMKYLAIDYGTKRIGIATSDDSGRMAFPLRVIPNTKDLIEVIAAICLAERIQSIVVGDSINFQNQPNPIMESVRPFAKELEAKTALPLHFMNEVLSSQEATHLQGDNTQNDASAAAIILQSYLNKWNPPKDEEHDGEI